MYTQLFDYMEFFLNQLLWGFRRLEQSDLFIQWTGGKMEMQLEKAAAMTGQ